MGANGGVSFSRTAKGQVDLCGYVTLSHVYVDILYMSFHNQPAIYGSI